MLRSIWKIEREEIDMLKNKQGGLIDTLIYLKAMLCNNMNCIVYYFVVN
jgi:hypothetical protein